MHDCCLKYELCKLTGLPRQKSAVKLVPDLKIFFTTNETESCKGQLEAAHILSTQADRHNCNQLH